LIVRSGDAGRVAVPPEAASLVLAGDAGHEGDWYVRAPGASPVAGALAGIAWDALPPAISWREPGPARDHDVVLTAALARRGPARPAVSLGDAGGTRRAVVHVAGLWRWRFRGGESAVAYSALVAGLTDWLLAGGPGRARGARATPEDPVAANARPITWRWSGVGAPRNVPVRLAGAGGEHDDTLRFAPAGRAELYLAPGVYRYTMAGGPEQGLVATETYSDEWRSGPVGVRAQPGSAGRGRRMSVRVREQWWLYVIALGALVGEWAWRRRQGLP
jgi:hypothetical protein